MTNSEEKKDDYTLFWSGEEISTGYLSKYYANELDEIKFKNVLLGDFSSKGKYSFNAEVKKALVAVKKIVDEKQDNTYYLISKTLKNTFTFKMKIFEVEDDSLLAASLYLIEVVDDERFTKPLKTFVAQYVDKKNDEFVNKAKYIFNVVSYGDFLENEKKENEDIIAPILPKPVITNEMMMELAAQNFVEEVVSVLENSEEGKKIIEQLKEKTELKDSEEKPSYRDIKKKLDEIVEKNKGFKTLVENNPEIAKSIEKYNKAVDDDKQVIKNTELSFNEFKELKDKENKEAKKEENKGAKKPTVKSSGDKSSGSGNKAKGGDKGDKNKSKGGKKKDKKDDKKKDPAWKGAVAPKLDKDDKKATPKKEEQKIIKNKQAVIPVVGKNTTKVTTKPTNQIKQKISTEVQPKLNNNNPKEEEKPKTKQEKENTFTEDIFASFVEDYEKSKVNEDIIEDFSENNKNMEVDVFSEEVVEETEKEKENTFVEENKQYEDVEKLNPFFYEKTTPPVTKDKNEFTH